MQEMIGHSLTEVQTFCKLFHASSGIPVHYLDPAGRRLAGFPSDRTAFFHNEQACCGFLASGLESGHSPIMISFNGLEYYIAIRYDQAGNNGMILLGPALFREMTGEMITGLWNDYGLSGKSRSELTAHFQSLPVMRKDQLKKACSLFYYFLYKREIDASDIAESHLYGPSEAADEQSGVERALMNQRQSLFLHPDMQYERRLLEFIREGRTKELKKHLEEEPQTPCDPVEKKPAPKCENRFYLRRHYSDKSRHRRRPEQRGRPAL
ncbi:PocR ligand-binding domain-containing protein [Paenibacillus sp. P25]|nr:PocR ligand-binding domain-containing protein [Paenibacillus sp. P25]